MSNTGCSGRESGTFRRRILYGAAIGLAIGLPIGFNSDTMAAVTDPTPQETLLQDALRKSPLKVDARVSCEKRLLFGLEKDRVGYVRVLPIFGAIHQVHLKQEICDDATEYINRKVKDQVSLHEVDGIKSLAHEGLHIAYDTSDEQATACREFQVTWQFMKSVGAKKEQRLAIQLMNDSLYSSKPPDYISEECVDGGVYDLNLKQKGDFPNQG